MIKHRIMSAATLLGGVVFTGHAVAQSPEVARRLDAKYDVVWPAADGLIRVNKGGYRIPDSRMKSNGKYGYADTLGQVVVPPAYDDAADFGNGHAVVGRKAGDGRMLYGLIDRSGRVVVPLEWERLGGVRDGGCVARTGTAAEREFSLADTLGYVRSLGYDYCSDFSNGLARVGVGAYVEKENVAGITLRDAYEFRGKFGYIAPDGRIVIPVQFDDARDFAQDGLAPVGIQGKYYVKWGFIDKSGRQVVPCNFYSAEEFLGDRAVVSKVVAGGKLAYGYIDRSGKEVIPCQFDMASGFRFANTWVGMEQDGEYTYTLIGPNGETVLPFRVGDLQDGGKYGHAAASISDAAGRKRFGIVANNGKVILPFEYDHIAIFRSGMRRTTAGRRAPWEQRTGKISASTSPGGASSLFRPGVFLPSGIRFRGRRVLSVLFGPGYPCAVMVGCRSRQVAG